MPSGGSVATDGDEGTRLLDEARAARARGDLSTAKSRLRAAAEAAQRSRAHRIRAAALEALGEVALEERDTLRGKLHWESAREAWAEAGDPRGIARAFEGLAALRALAGERGPAAEAYRQAEARHRAAGDVAGASRCRQQAHELDPTGAGDAGEPAVLAAQASGALRPRDMDARSAAFLELLRDATARLADPRAAAAEDAVLLALKGTIALTGTERGFVARRGPQGLAFLAGLDFRGRRLEAKDFKVSTTIVGSVLESGRALSASDLRESERFANATSVNELGLRAALCAPLPPDEGQPGVLYVDARSERPFGPEDLRFFESVANCTAALYRSARLRDQLQASHQKIAELNKQLEAKVEKQGQELEKQGALLERARQELSLKHEYPEIVGKSPAVGKLLKLVDRVAETTFPVLIEGESGTGKELVARAVHRASQRRERPFLSLNCAAVAGGLIESELFGHVRGAFTGALADRPGLFELADGGTLLLDEVGEMSKEMQASLLRVLQEHEIRRVGGKEIKKVDVRVVAATNRDLQEHVRQGHFREDLYYRLAVLKVRIPPLRERKEDVPDLVRHLLAKHAKAENREAPALEPAALEALAAYEWPGNVREVENAARFFLAFAGDRIARAHVDRLVQQSRSTHPQPAQPAAPATPGVDVADAAAGALSLRDIERAVIDGRLRANQWHQKKTAQSLGIDRKTLYRKIREYGLAIDVAGNLPPPEDSE